MTDRTCKKRSGQRIDLLLLRDSIAAGLGAYRPQGTLGAHVAKRLAKSMGRPVRLTTIARVGTETSMLAAQLSSSPRDEQLTWLSSWSAATT